jgi:hypothetical protein
MTGFLASRLFVWEPPVPEAEAPKG